jgi:5,10-methenyltetrahydromethanopterin hydrogenase
VTTDDRETQELREILLAASEGAKLACEMIEVSGRVSAVLCSALVSTNREAAAAYLAGYVKVIAGASNIDPIVILEQIVSTMRTLSHGRGDAETVEAMLRELVERTVRRLGKAPDDDQLGRDLQVCEESAEARERRRS